MHVGLLPSARLNHGHAVLHQIAVTTYSAPTPDDLIVTSEPIPDKDSAFAGDCPCGQRATMRVTLNMSGGLVFYMCEDCATNTVVAELKKHLRH